MKGTRLVLASVIAGVAFISMPEPAGAQPKGCPPGLKKQGRCGEFLSRKLDKRGDDRVYRRRDDDRGYRESLDLRGLDRAYEDGYRDGLEDGRYRIGDVLARDRYSVLDRDLYYDRYGRRLDDGYYYAEADGERLLIEAATGAIIDLLAR